MLKMLLDPMGGIVMTNDGNAILREVDVSHPAAKNMIELSRAQDEEVGDGTTSVIILAGELLGVAEPLLEKKLHPTLIVSGYMKALEDAQTLLKELAYPVDVDDPKALGEIVRGSIDTKFASRFGSLISDLAIQAVKTVCIVKPDGRKEIDVKRFAKVEKIQGGELSDCKVLDGVMFNKDITHPRMRREIKNPRVVLLDCPLEYKKGESQTNVEITKEADWEKLLQQEEEEMRRVCDDILKVKPDLVITEKGVSDLAQHFLMKGGCSVIRRIRKTDNHRIARVTGAHICNRTEELQESMVGTRCGRFKVQKIGEEYFTFLTECKDPKACSIILRGATRDVLNEIERNLQDAFGVARNIILEPLLLPGGGAVEMELAARLKEKSKTIEGSRQYAYKAVGEALEVIPRSLAHNCGADVVRAMTDLRARHATAGNAAFGIDGKTGKVADVKELSIFDTFAVKVQTLRSWVGTTRPSGIPGTDENSPSAPSAAAWAAGEEPKRGAERFRALPALPLRRSTLGVTRDCLGYHDKILRCAKAAKKHVLRKAGDAERAESWFSKMTDADFRPDLQAYNILMSAYAAGGDMDGTDEVLRSMQEVQCTPDAYTFSTAIQSCVPPGTISFNSAIATAVKAGNADAATQLAEEMKQSGKELRSAFGHRHLYISWVLSALAKETERLPSTALETVNDICSTSSENVSCWKLSLHWLEMVNLSAIKGNMDEAEKWIEVLKEIGQPKRQCFCMAASPEGHRCVFQVSQITSIDANLQAWSRVQHVHEEQQCDSSKFARALEANQSINTGGLLAARRASDAFNITYTQDFSVATMLDLAATLRQDGAVRPMAPVLCVKADMEQVREEIQFSLRGCTAGSAERLQGETPTHEARPDGIVAMIALRDALAASSGLLKERRFTLDMMLQEEMLSPAPFNCLMAGYGKVLTSFEGNLEAAEGVLMRMRNCSVSPNLESYNTLTKVYAQEWLENMQQTSVSPNQVTFSTILRSCEKDHSVALAGHFLKKMQEMDVEPNRAIFNTLLNLYASARQLALAEGIFKEMVRKAEMPDLLAFGALVKAAARIPDMQRSLLWMERARNAALSPDARMFYSLLSSCAQVGDLPAIHQVLGNMKAQGLPEDVVTCAAVVRACGNAHDLKEAEKTLERLETIKPNEYTVNAMMTACASTKFPTKAEYWFSRLARKGAHIEVVGFNSLMANWKEDSMRMQHWLMRMRSVDVSPDVITFNGLLNSAAIVCDAGFAKRLWSDMEEIGKPTLGSYRAFAKALAREGHVQELAALLGRMEKSKFSSDVFCMRALLTACAAAKSKEAAQMAEELFRQHRATFAKDSYARQALRLATGNKYAKLAKEFKLEIKSEQDTTGPGLFLQDEKQSRSTVDFVLQNRTQHVSRGQAEETRRQMRSQKVRFETVQKSTGPTEPSEVPEPEDSEDTSDASGSFVLTSSEKLGPNAVKHGPLLRTLSLESRDVRRRSSARSGGRVWADNGDPFAWSLVNIISGAAERQGSLLWRYAALWWRSSAAKDTTAEQSAAAVPRPRTGGTGAESLGEGVSPSSLLLDEKGVESWDWDFDTDDDLAEDDSGEGKTEQSRGPECEKEANETRRLLQELGFVGELDSKDHCSWPGITCRDSCMVIRLHCDQCAGRLPQHIDLQDLQKVMLTSQNLSGNIEAFRNLQQLQDVYLGNTKVDGDIAVFSSTPLLHRLSMGNTHVGGRIDAFRATPFLAHVSLQNTEVSGDIDTFVSTPKLIHLSLTQTRVTGRVETFRATPGLGHLHLEGTQVTGDLQTFDATPGLTELHLGSTGVRGKIEVLKSCGALQVLLLQRTKVWGNLGPFVQAFSFLNLRRLSLGSTQVTGDLSTLVQLEILEEADLSKTEVTGGLTEAWRGKLKHLHTLKLSHSAVHFAPREGQLTQLKEHWAREYQEKQILPNLVNLELSGCPVNSSMEALLMPLAMSSLTVIKAASAGLFGEVPKLQGRVCTHYVSADKACYLQEVPFRLPFYHTLRILDFSENLVTIAEPPFAVGSRVLLRGIHGLRLGRNFLAAAVGWQVMLDMRWSELENQEGALELLTEGIMKCTESFDFRDDQAGFACRELVEGTLQVTPSKFLPDRLCRCVPGWHGTGAACIRCPQGTFSEQMGQTACSTCPANSTSPVGSTKESDCQCSFGSLQANGRCGCDVHQALQGSSCVPCARLHLQCNGTGHLASEATPEVNYTRLEDHSEEAHRCLPPEAFRRCPGAATVAVHCGSGYDGTLCARCAEGFWATKGRCQPCAAASSASIWSLAGLGIAAAFALAAFFGYRWIYGVPQPPGQSPPPPSAKSLLQKLISLQGPVLLQTAQLWGVLSHLGTRLGTSLGEGLVEVPYLEALQLTTTELQNSLNLQCTFDPQTVRTLAALSSPLAPLLLLLCCPVLELYRPGFGVSMALKILTVLFIGGASSTAELLSCQYEDGDGERLEHWAFRKAFPEFRCSKQDGLAFWVDAVGYSSAVAYGVLVPLFLASLMVRQYFALQKARLFISQAQVEPQRTSLQLQMLRLQQLPKEELPSRLMAAAAAHLAVHCRGKIHVQLLDGKVTLASTEVNEATEEIKFSAAKLIADVETSKDLDMLRSRKITEMLTERLVLQASSDRFLVGAQPLLCKYTLCQDVWMEVAMKLFAVGLVSCVSMSDAWKWAIAFSLGMAVLIGVAQPYMQPQISQLQSLSCFCLALASAAFVYDCAWLARASLLAPILLLLWQVQHPDCIEALAKRLYQELQSELPTLQRGEAHELHVQRVALQIAAVKAQFLTFQLTLSSRQALTDLFHHPCGMLIWLERVSMSSGSSGNGCGYAKLMADNFEDPNIVTFSALINAFEEGQHWEK
ncbi:T-complex protein 1 subunit gamma (TCP-1-gamma) (CCT-gamma) (Chaperonin subunit CCTV gamma) [Durusdinium trenchii]|uniref:T-complex protein 1 subunit gamma n=1 Tax=Durusdinium trenchii TaxID=1381693 RepID=A0ABP0LZ01_9DINO